MKITIKMLRQYDEPCSDGRKWFNKQKSHELTDLVKTAIKSGIEEMLYCNWGLTHCMTKVQMVKYSCFAARQVLKNYTDKHPNDDRVLKAIEMAEAWENNPSDGAAVRAAASAADSAAASAADSAAAHAAVRAAASAAHAAVRAAASAAASAADSAADSAAASAADSAAASAAHAAVRAAYSAAAHAADSAAYSAARAANSAAHSAARLRMMAKILRYGVKILMEGL